MAKSLCLLALCLLVVGCGATPVSRSVTNNPEVPVALLFSHEGVKVYRFEDGGRFHYYAVASSSATTFSSWTENCGKNCTRIVNDEIQTVAAR